MARDPTKRAVHNDFPGLPYDEATRSISALTAVEDGCIGSFVDSFRVSVLVWEYGYYFLDRFLRSSKLKSHDSVVPATLFAQGHGALRGSFLQLARGYPDDAVATLRRVHEGFVKACDCASSPNRTLVIIRTSDLRPSERRLGLQFDRLYKTHASFLHASFQTLDVLKAMQERRPPRVRYGPRHDDWLAKYAATVSLFWLYFGIKAAPVLFPGVADGAWIALQPDSARFLRVSLSDRGSSLVKECDQVDSMLERLAKRVTAAY